VLPKTPPRARVSCYIREGKRMGSSWTYEQEYVKCGKKTCGRCPHGPYWYRYQRRGKRTHKEYVGKVLMDAWPEGEPKPAEPPRDPWEEMLTPGGPKLAQALADLGVKETDSLAHCKSAYRALLLLHHPDRGGSELKAKATIAAWSYLRRYKGW